MLFEHILNPKMEMATPTSLASNLFVGLDCEMDQGEDQQLICKVSIVAEEDGSILLDTLVKPETEIVRSHSRIHGINKEWLTDAPSFKDV